MNITTNLISVLSSSKRIITNKKQVIIIYYLHLRSQLLPSSYQGLPWYSSLTIFNFFCWGRLGQRWLEVNVFLILLVSSTLWDDTRYVNGKDGTRPCDIPHDIDQTTYDGVVQSLDWSMMEYDVIFLSDRGTYTLGTITDASSMQQVRSSCTATASTCSPVWSLCWRSACPDRRSC